MRWSLALAYLALGAAATQAQPAAAIRVTPAAASKKAAYLDGKRPARAAAPRLTGKPPTPVVNLRNTWTDEWMVVELAGKLAVPDDQVDRFLRDHYTNDPTHMDPKLIGVLREAAAHFGARRIEIVSGFRAPKYNLMLRKKGHEVAKDSQHTQGHAVDFRIPGVDVRDLEKWAVDRRKGGVGLYLDSKFIHVDVGPFRRWNGS